MMLSFTLRGFIRTLFPAKTTKKNFNSKAAIRKNIFLFSLILFSFIVNAQKIKFPNKIDPIFQSLIDQKDVPEARKQTPTSHKIEPVEGFAYKGAPLEKKFTCIVYTYNGKALRDSGIFVNSILPTFATAWVTLDEIITISAFKDVKFIEAPRADNLHNDISVASSGAALLHSGKLNNTPYKGKGVIVAVYDTGIDWDHPDFRNATDQSKSRILRIWDQTITAIGSEVPPTGYSYGVEYTQAHINDELDGSPAGFVRENDINGHGTHVAGTAAGNGAALGVTKYTGMAPEADLIIIKGGNSSFPTTNTVDAITYLQGLANTLGRPIVLNMSIGGQFGAHDGTRPHEIAVDNFTTSGPGRVVVISAGNDNGTNIHNRVTLTSGASSNVSFTVPAGTAGTDVFEYRIYVNGSDDISATVTVPGTGETLTANAGQSTNSFVMTSNFRIWLTNAIDGANGHRYVNLYLQRNGSNTASPAGTWTLALTNNTSNTLTLDGWLNYRNSSFSNTALVGGDNVSLVGSPGNATTAITVASYVGRLRWQSSAGSSVSYTGPQQDNISTFSAIGPRRDGVLKPEIAMHGQAVVSALSSDHTPSANDIVEAGLYRKNQGTSMSAPGVAGAVALLLQAKPTATASEIKGLLTSTATTDALTGALPNTTWGYGKINVFKAAASMFNCSPAEMKMYQYDNSFTSTTDGSGSTKSTQRIAVKITPDINGKLAGIHFHSSQSKTDMVVEVRTNNAGNPGTLLGTLNAAAANLSFVAWNYIDLNSLNISVTTSSDYFIVLYRNSSNSWSIRTGTILTGNRSLESTNGGASWTNPGVDFRIRPFIYNSQQLSGTLAGHNSNDTRDISTSVQLINNCNLIAQLVPNGADPVSGDVTGNLWVESGVPYWGNQPYVSRHYEVTPAVNAGSATGNITLYFTQAEFDAFNNDAGSAMDLPVNSGDALGKSNLRIVKLPGTSSNGTGLPTTYSGSKTVIDPDDANIIWNIEMNRWEINFDVTGFSGFIVQTTVSILPVKILYFTGKKQSSIHILNWKAECTDGSTAVFELQRSGDGVNFTDIGSVSTNQFNCSEEHEYIDAIPLAGKNFYRLKIVENTGLTKYSSILLLNSAQSGTTVYPTVIRKGSNLQVNFNEAKGILIITDAIGKQVYEHSLMNGAQSLNINLQVSGVYFFTVKNESGHTLTTGKLIVE